MSLLYVRCTNGDFFWVLHYTWSTPYSNTPKYVEYTVTLIILPTTRITRRKDSHVKIHCQEWDSQSSRDALEYSDVWNWFQNMTIISRVNHLCAQLSSIKTHLPTLKQTSSGNQKWQLEIDGNPPGTPSSHGPKSLGAYRQLFNGSRLCRGGLATW